MYLLKTRHDPPEILTGGPKLDIHVVFTKIPGTQAPLTAATDLARHLGGRVAILVAQVVPYPLPLDRPPIPVEFTEQALASLGRDPEVETAVRIYLCRDQQETIRQVLKPESVVIVGARGLAKTLKRDGHHVILV